MSSIKIFLNSTIGKKILVATTGLLFCLFLLFHLFNNLVIYTGEENFNFLVSSLEKIKPLIRVLEVGLAATLIVHIVNSITLSIQSRRAVLLRANPQQKNTTHLYLLAPCFLRVAYFSFLL